MERVSGYDLWRADDVAVAARPFTWRGRLAKIAVVAVPYRERSASRPSSARPPSSGSRKPIRSSERKWGRGRTWLCRGRGCCLAICRRMPLQQD